MRSPAGRGYLAHPARGGGPAVQRQLRATLEEPLHQAGDARWQCRINCGAPDDRDFPSIALWYASRATGVVSLLLLTLVVMLGILVNRQGRLPGLPAFAVTGLHRSLSLLAVLFIAVHVATAVIDPYVSIGLAAVVIPFASAYQPLWLGLGAVALDLIAALVVTSLARAHLSRRAWRGIHWLAYAAWPVALVHGLGSSTDLRSGGLLCWRSAARWRWPRPACGGWRARPGRCRGPSGPPTCSRAPSGRPAARPRRSRRGPMTHHATLPLPGPGQWAAGDGPPPAARRRAWPGGLLPRLMPARAGPVGLEAHLARFGAPPYRGAPRRLIGDVEAAGLTGRGGAAFPTYRKLAAMAAGRGPAPVVIGNGAEGEPASSKDKSLLWFSPHLVLDGLQLAAEAVGSATAGLYIHRNPRLHARLAAAIAERAAAGLDAAGVELIEAPPRFLAGEESALASRVSGGPALPRFKPPRASQRGVAGLAHPGAERRDAGAPGPHRPLRPRLVPLRRHRG